MHRAHSLVMNVTGSWNGPCLRQLRSDVTLLTIDAGCPEARRMWNEASVRRDHELSDTNRDRMEFVDAKGIEWRVLCRNLPEREDRIALHFASATGKRRNSE